MKKILNFLMVMLLVMGLGMASVMTAVQAEAAETAETAGETVSAAGDCIDSESGWGDSG